MSTTTRVRKLSAADAAYLAGLIDGEGTIALSRKHARENRQLVVAISNTERPILDFARSIIGAGKITRKRTAQAHHAAGLTYVLTNRQALSLLRQIHRFLRSYKRARAQLVLENYVALTPRNGKYTDDLRTARAAFEVSFSRLVASREPLQSTSR